MTAVSLAVASAILLAPVATHEVQPVQQGTVAAAPSLSPEGAAALDAAKAAFKANQWQPALDAALKVLAEQPGHRDALYIAGSSESQLGQLDTGEKHLRALAEDAPSYPLVHYRLGYVVFAQAEALSKSGDPEQGKARYSEAADEFGKELERDAGQAGSASSRAIALARAGRLDEAIQAHEGWIAIAGDANEPYISLAATYALADRPQDAMAALDRMPDPNQEATATALAAVMRGFLEQHNAKAALPFLERAVKLEPASAKARAALVEGYAGAMRYDEAVESLKILMTMNPDPEDLDRAGNAIRATIGDGKSSISVPGVDPPMALKVPQARRGGGKDNVETNVPVLVKISPSGEPIDSLVVPDRSWQETRSSGLEKEALESVRKSKFKAGTKDGAPVPLWTVVAVKVRGASG